MVAAKGGVAHIPTSRERKVQRTVAPHLYRRRNLVERFFNRLKQFRRIATRYDKHALTFLTAVILATTRIWKRFESAV
jgi:transposase